MARRKRRRGIRWHSLFLWHRYLGLVAFVFVVLLAGSGLLLNHSGDLRLDERHVRPAWLLDRYGISAPSEIVGFNAGGRWISQVGERIYFDTCKIVGDAGPLIGVVAQDDMVVVALTAQVLLLTPGGSLIERLGEAQGVPSGLNAIGLDGSGHLIVRAAGGAFTADAMVLDWHQVEPRAPVNWTRPAPLPSGLRTRLVDIYRGDILTYERVLLDMHSGRILGPAGIYLFDAAAIALLALSLLGIWMWKSRRR